MKVAENVVENVRNIAQYTFWGVKDNFYAFLQKNEYFTTPTFSMKEISDYVDEITFEYDDANVKCLLEWKDSDTNDGFVISKVTIGN